MQGVSELVEHGAHVVGGEQGGLSSRRLGKIGYVYHNRLGTHQLRLLDEVVHPGTALFVIALEVIGVEERERAAVSVEDFKDTHIGVVHRKVFALFEGDSVQLS